MSETETGTESLARTVEAGVAAARAELAASANFARDAVRLDAALRAVAAACDAAITIAGQIIAARRLGTSDGSRASFGLLQEAGLITEPMRAQLVSLAGFRNLATKQCSPMDLLMVETVIRGELGALVDFAELARRLDR